MWVENPPSALSPIVGCSKLHAGAAVTGSTGLSLLWKSGWKIHPHCTVKVTNCTFPSLKYGWKIHPHCTIKEDQLWCLFVCLFVIPIYPFKVHAMCINELEAFLEFQAKISENNWILGKNVVLWVHFHPASTVKVNRDGDLRATTGLWPPQQIQLNVSCQLLSEWRLYAVSHLHWWRHRDGVENYLRSQLQASLFGNIFCDYDIRHKTCEDKRYKSTRIIINNKITIIQRVQGLFPYLWRA
jgi:hypothetical protein